MKPVDFLARHPVFRIEDFAAAHTAGRELSAHASKAVLQQHLRAGHLLRIRRGLYATVPRGTSPEEHYVDPFQIAAHAAPDAVVAYHAALELHGHAHSVSNRMTFLTTTGTKRFEFRGTEFVPVPVPSALRQLPDHGGGVLDIVRGGVAVPVTTLERTFVDVLDSPRYGGGWEEIWRSLESVEFFDLDAVIDYALALGSAATIAKVGFYLEQHEEQLMVEPSCLGRLEQHAPAQPRYLERSKRESGKLLNRWNLVVPQWLLDRAWGEVA